MSAQLKEIIQRDDALSPEMNSWTKPPDGFELLIQESPNFSLALDDEGNKLLIQ
jgi:hypothetical protein